jgi:hypothetical protein
MELEVGMQEEMNEKDEDVEHFVFVCLETHVVFC